MSKQSRSSRGQPRTAPPYSRPGRPSSPHQPIQPSIAQPQRSVFRDAAAVAGGVTVGTTMGTLAGNAIASMFRGPRLEEVQAQLPRDYSLTEEPSGPCAYEIKSFLNCAASNEDISHCQAFSEALKQCKKRNGTNKVVTVGDGGFGEEGMKIQ